MANSGLSVLTPTLYNALDRVSREMVGFIPAVMRDATFERAAVGQTVMSPVAPAVVLTDITPGVTPPNDGDQTLGNVSMTLTKQRRGAIRWNGEEIRGLQNNGPGVSKIMSDQFYQAIRAIVNEIEADIAALHIAASRATGTAGVPPFGTALDLSATAGAARILEDNGAQGLDWQMVLGSAAWQNIRGKQTGLFKVNEAGTAELLRQGSMGILEGFNMRNSAQIKTFTPGTGASATTNSAGYAVGATVITLASTGTGTLIAGDNITFAGDSNQYEITVGDADVSNGGTFTLAAPGLLKALAASAVAITVVASSVRNMFFARSAIALACRIPALPPGGDVAEDSTTISDPISGLTFEVREYKQYRQTQFEVAAVWGVKAVKPEHIGVLLG